LRRTGAAPLITALLINTGVEARQLGKWAVSAGAICLRGRFAIGLCRLFAARSVSTFPHFSQIHQVISAKAGTSVQSPAARQGKLSFPLSRG
jgi:hypothetical protein